jgi:hypothetical protein
MNDLEVAQTAIATLADKLNAATARADEMAITRQKLGFLVYTANDATARRELNALNTEMATLVEETQDLKAALVQAHAKLDAAKAAAMRTDANEHRVRARAILGELTALGPELDRTIPHPDDGVPYAFSDPPTVCKTAALAHALVVECRALGLGRDATFPKSWHGAAGKIDGPASPGKSGPPPAPRSCLECVRLWILPDCSACGRKRCAPIWIGTSRQTRRRLQHEHDKRKAGSPAFQSENRGGQRS